MDVTLLRNRIQSTVDPNADVRRQAELDLRYVSFLLLLFPECAKKVSQGRRTAWFYQRSSQHTAGGTGEQHTPL